MATRFVNIDRDTPLLLPPDLRDWVPATHLAHFVIDAVEALDVRSVKVNTRGTGDEQYPPLMLLGLLVYSYATGTFGSRRIEQSTYDNIAVRLITADTHPDHDTLCTFRRENKALLHESFIQVLQLAHELKFAQFGQITVSIDGSKIAANASKHSAVSYERAGQMLEQLELEVQQLLAKAEQADATPLQDGLTIPDELVRRQERKAALEKARAEIETRAHARYAAELAEHEKKMAARLARQQEGEKLRGKVPTPPSPEPQPKDQYNFTDPESRIMKTGGGFEQCYNAQAAVEVDSRLIVGERVSQAMRRAIPGPPSTYVTPGKAPPNSSASSGKCVQARTTVSIRSPAGESNIGCAADLTASTLTSSPASLASASSTSSGEPWRMSVQSAANLAARSST